MQIILTIMILLFQANYQDDLGLNLLNQMNIENKGYERQFFSLKENKNNSNTSICLLPVIVSIDTVNDYESKTIYPYLIEFNTKTVQIIRIKKINHDVGIDATGPWKIELVLDYKIKPEVWSIGVIIDWHTKSWENWGWESLFVFEPLDSTFNEIFVDDISSRENYRGISCEYHGQEVTNKIVIDTTHLVNDYFPIIIESEYERFISNANCQDTTINANAEFTYIMEGGQFKLIDEKGKIPFVEFWDDEEENKWFDWKNRLK